jgi:hypothetical protein
MSHCHIAQHHEHNHNRHDDHARQSMLASLE